MMEPQFFAPGAGLTAGEIAALTGAELRPGADLERRVTGIAPLDRAGPADLAFLDDAKLADQLASTGAGICLLSKRFADRAPAHLTLLVVRAPFRAFVIATRALFPSSLRPAALSDRSGVAQGAIVDPSARLENGVTVDFGAIVGGRVEIGAGTLIGANSVIGADVRIGRNCAIGAGATVYHALIGDRVIVHPGARIGQDGFGFVPGANGHLKVPQVGRVIIQDDVEVGANTTIDRGSISDTVIGEGTKIDNLVQIAHNVTVGRHCFLAGQVGISGSVTLEDYVMLGGQAGVVDHIVIGEGAQIAAKAAVMMGNVPAGAKMFGIPARPKREVFREMLALARLARMRQAGAVGDPSDTSGKNDEHG